MKSIHLLLPFADPTLISSRNHRLRLLSAAKLQRPGTVERILGGECAMAAPFQFERRNQIDSILSAAIPCCSAREFSLPGQPPAIRCKVNLSTFRIIALLPPAPRWCAILAATRRRRHACSCAPTRPPGRLLRALTLLLLLLAPLPNRARPSTVRVPFRTVGSMILVEGQVNGHRITFLLDTGADKTIVSVKSYGNLQFPLRRVQRSKNAPGMTGESLRLPADLRFANHVWAGQRVSVMDLDDLKRILGIDLDGLLGEDILREFRSIRIDYHAHVIELED
jgi:gag-polyprotein putative aspartyl protease